MLNESKSPKSSNKQKIHTVGCMLDQMAEKLKRFDLLGFKRQNLVKEKLLKNVRNPFEKRKRYSNSLEKISNTYKSRSTTSSFLKMRIAVTKQKVYCKSFNTTLTSTESAKLGLTKLLVFVIYKK